MMKPQMEAFELIYLDNHGGLGRHLVAQRAHVQQMRQNIYRNISQEMLEEIVGSFKARGITITVLHVENIMAFYPEVKMHLFNGFNSDVRKMVHNVFAQFYLGTNWPPTTSTVGALQEFAKILNREIHNSAYYDLAKPHSYT